jgi:hypothetical protein
MAEHGTVEYAEADGNDYSAHERTYESFLALLKWSILAIIVVLILMGIFLT